MVKAKQKTNLQIRDGVILLLVLAVIATNWVWYQHHQAQELSHESHVEFGNRQQVQINKLKACIDEGTNPCDITPSIPE